MEQRRKEPGSASELGRYRILSVVFDYWQEWHKNLLSRAELPSAKIEMDFKIIQNIKNARGIWNAVINKEFWNVQSM